MTLGAVLKAMCMSFEKKFCDDICINKEQAPLKCDNKLRINKMNVKKIGFGNKEHSMNEIIGVSVLLTLFISSNEACNTAYALYT